MSETQAAAASTKKAKTATVYESVQMEDGRKVDFAGTRKTDKTILADEAGNAYGVRFDFRNGATRQILFNDLSPAVQLYACGHGISQKAGDEYSGVKEVDDMVLSVDEIFTRLRAGDWAAPSEGGDSMAGASIVIRAIVEATGKSVEIVKNFLQGKLDKAAAAGEKLSRQELYNSFRDPGTPTGAIIKRMEEEKLAKSNKVNAGSLLAELGE